MHQFPFFTFRTSWQRLLVFPDRFFPLPDFFIFISISFFLSKLKSSLTPLIINEIPLFSIPDSFMEIYYSGHTSLCICSYRCINPESFFRSNAREYLFMNGFLFYNHILQMKTQIQNRSMELYMKKGWNVTGPARP